MAEDVNIVGRGYDEDLCENHFFKYMQTKHKQLYEEAARNRWTICIPRRGTQARGSFTQVHVENHILRPVEGNPLAFKTANNKEVQVRGEFIVTTEGFHDVKSVQILFEETFFNNENQSFAVLCIEQPLEGGIGGSLEPAVLSLDNLQACCAFLWNNTGSKQTQQQEIDNILKIFNSSCEQLEGESLRHLMDAVHAIYSRAMQTVLKNSQLRKLAQHNNSYMENVKLAIETYVMDKLHDQLFKGISSIVGKEDVLLNKTTRNLADIQVKDLGVKEQLCPNLPRGKRALSSLNKYKSPLEKFHCLKKVVTILTDRKMKSQSDAEEAITVDDFLPALIFLVIKSDIPNWLANITFLHNFHFSMRGQNEFQFFLSSIEAAVEHIRGGSVNDIRKGHSPAKFMPSPWLLEEKDGPNEKTALEKLFEFASNGNEEEIGKLLSEPGVAREKLLCHPLCSCDKCEKLHTRKRHDPSAVTVFSRDDLGRTVLHVASEYGWSYLILKLIKRGAVVNAMDYLGTTALHLACQRGQDNAALMLLHYKADVNAPDNDGNTPLHLCTANGHEKCTKAMIHFDMQFNVLKVNAANEHGDTPLHLASRWGYADIVRLLLENGASLEARNKDKSTPLDSSYNKQVTEILLVAIAKASEEQEKMLLSPKRSKSVTKHPLTQAQKFPKPTSKDQEKAKEIDQFMRIVAEEDVEMVRFKLGSSDDEEDEEDSGERPHSEQDLCHPLCQCDKCSKWQKKSREAAEKIIHANVRNAEGMTPLHVAAIRGFDEMTSLLLRRGAQTDVKNYTQRRAPLHFACQYNHPRVAGLLLSHQAKVNIKDYKGNTPLHLCCFAGHLDPAVILLGHGAGINATNDVGDAPLHVAARFNLVKHVNLFLENGASVTIRNKKELTPLQCAQRDDVIRALDQAEGFNYNARRNQLTYSDYRLHNSGYTDSKTPPNHRSNLVPTHSNTSAAKKQPFSVPSPSDPTRVAQFRDDSSAEALEPHERLNKLFERLEKGHVERLQDIGKAVKSFDRRRSLRKIQTIDKSSPLIDFQLKHQLSIHHFDHSSLRKVQTRDHSQLITREERGEVIDVKNEDNGDDAST
ncbi:ankyrin repeat domain-containing protein 27-like isoform X2 [Acropora millepora]|uniref:ankyrin repeat domain-containing protein 27-like isoform X1 n=1 Tax=Acropora millepora TaxID=45264 RepID=UPI001CF5B10D|nr:ankyrin repeat domain-containing protein 27-like isoform X1 [Acropora millepora]XP_044175915.1 ankyrin repeat domain-containing protein 27-like isoform X2 [Acropora millepora]